MVEYEAEVNIRYIFTIELDEELDDFAKDEVAEEMAFNMIMEGEEPSLVNVGLFEID